MTMKQVEELKRIEPWSREYGAAAFARRHGMTVPKVYHWRRKLGMPMAKWCGRAALVMLAFLAFDAAAEPWVLRWKAPADLTDVQDYRIRVGRCGSGLNLAMRGVGKQFTSATMDIPADGRLYCAQIVAMGPDNSESAPLEFAPTSFPIPNFSVSVSLNQNYVPIGTEVTATWATQGVASCVRFITMAGVSGAEAPIALSGTEAVPNLTGTMLFVVTCRSPSGAIAVGSAAVATYRPVPPPVTP